MGRWSLVDLQSRPFALDHCYYPIAVRALEDLVARELERLTEAIPARDLAIQWDMAYETQDLHGVLAWTPEGAWERFAGPVRNLTRLIPTAAVRRGRARRPPGARRRALRSPGTRWGS